MNSFRWAPLPSFAANVIESCVIASPISEVVRAAARVFAPWKCDGNYEANLPDNTLRWNVESEPQGFVARAAHDDEILCADDVNFLIAQIEYATLRRLVERLDDSLTGFHGALLERDGRGVLLVGPKEAGKSTLSCALWRSGWNLRCDDFSLVTNDAQALPAPRRVSLREGSRVLLGEALWQRVLEAPSSFPTKAGVLFHPHEVDGSAPTKTPVPLAAIVFLGRRETLLQASTENAESLLKPLAPFAAALALLPYSTLLDRTDWPDSPEIPPETHLPMGDWGLHLPRLARLCDAVPAFDLQRGRLEFMQTALERAVLKS